jgi:hypothetical protein
MSDNSETGSRFGGESSNNLAQKIRDKLMVDEKKLFDEMLEKSSKYIQLDSAGGIHFISLGSLRKLDAISLFLLGKRLAKDAGLIKDDITDAWESARATGMTKPVAAARLHDLVVSGRAESPDRAKFRVVIATASYILADVEANIRKGEKNANE